MVRAIVVMVIMGISGLLHAAEPVSKSYWGGVAISGHDTVAYYDDKTKNEHAEVKGDKRVLVQWGGAKWYFASQASADKFAADPERYKPQYNGHCSNALALGEGLISTDGTVWEFFGDKLHLFYAERGRQRWLNGDWQQYKKEADMAWAEILTQQ